MWPFVRAHQKKDACSTVEHTEHGMSFVGTPLGYFKASGVPFTPSFHCLESHPHEQFGICS